MEATISVTLSNVFDFPFSIRKLNHYLDFYGRSIENLIRYNLTSTKKEGAILDIGAGSQKYRYIISGLNLKYESCDLPGSPNASNQDFLCDAAQLTVLDDSYDFCLQIQVLEHLKSPEASIAEISRILRPGGKLLLATNFLYPIHGEPNDFFRFTKYGLEHLIENSGMKLISIVEIGGFFKFLSTSLQYQRDFFFQTEYLTPSSVFFKILITPFRLFINVCLTVICIVLNQIDQVVYLPKFTTGYFLVGQKQ